jgi:hypothetical protein
MQVEEGIEDVVVEPLVDADATDAIVLTPDDVDAGSPPPELEKNSDSRSSLKLYRGAPALMTGQLFANMHDTHVGYGDWGSTVRPPVLSRNLGRDNMESLTSGKPEPPPWKTKPKRVLRSRLIPGARRINHVVIHYTYPRIKHSPTFTLLCNKLWDSIACGGLTLTFRVKGRPLLPRKWFMDYVITPKWIPALRSIHRQKRAMGYAIVLYGHDPENDGELVPRVLEPDEGSFFNETPQHRC